jgi:hypothetical protein
MEIKDGGAVENIRDKKIHTIKIIAIDNHSFELWVNDSLSYLTINEALQLKDELQTALINSIK